MSRNVFHNLKIYSLNITEVLQYVMIVFIG